MNASDITKKSARCLNVVGKFIGRDGSMGFRKGFDYELWVFLRNGDGKIYISRRDLNAIAIPYDTTKAVDKNWQFIEVST